MRSGIINFIFRRCWQHNFVDSANYDRREAQIGAKLTFLKRENIAKKISKKVKKFWQSKSGVRRRAGEELVVAGD